MNLKFWKKKPPSLNYFENFPPKRRIVIILHEIISAIITAIIAIWESVVVTVAGVAITVGTIVKAVLIVGAVVYAYASSKKSGKQGAGAGGGGSQSLINSGHLINAQSTSEPVPIVYGTIRKGGNRVYVNATGTQNEFIHIILTISEGPVKGIKTDVNGDKIYLDGTRIQDFGAFAYWEFFRGTGDQDVCATLHTADPNWKDAMRWTAYLYLRLTYDQEKFSQLPDITLELEGREIYDPRNGLTQYSHNPALVALDFLRNDRYSLGINPTLPLTLINSDSIKDVANWSDANGYEFNGSVIERKSFIDNLDDILRNFRTGIIWSEGEYKMFVYEYDTPVMTLTEDDIIANSFKINVPGIPETPNRVLMTYPDIVDNYISKTRIIEDRDAVLLYDLQERDFELELIGTTSALQATKLGNYYLERNRLNRQHSFTCHPRVLALEPMDMIQITHSLPGWTEKIVRILDMDLRQDGLVQLSVLEEYPELYDDIVNTTVHGYFETNLPTPYNPQLNVADLPGVLAEEQHIIDSEVLAIATPLTHETAEIVHITSTNLEKIINKGTANGYAPLNADSKVPIINMGSVQGLPGLLADDQHVLDAEVLAMVQQYLPWMIDIDLFGTAKSNVNFDTNTVDATYIYNVYRKSSGIQNDSIAWDVILTVGTWSIELIYMKNADQGIFSIQFDSIEKGTIDAYNVGPLINQRSSITGIIISATSKIELKLKMATKNESSTGYQGTINGLRLIRTA